MYCKKCGSKIDEKDKFCSNCGIKVEYKSKSSKEPIKVKLTTFILLIVVLMLVMILVLVFWKNIADNNISTLNNNDVMQEEITQNTNIKDTSIKVENNEEENNNSYDDFICKAIINDKYIFINSQGYIQKDVNENVSLPLIEGFKLEENLLFSNKLCDKDLNYLDTIKSIIETTKEEKIYDMLTKIIIENNEYVLYFESQKKYVYLGDNQNINNKMKYTKVIMQNENTSGKIYVNGNFQEGFKAYFTQDINAETIDNTKFNGSNNLYGQIYTGMSYYEVYSILGEPASTTRNTDMFTTYVWTTKEGVIVIQFMNGQVYQKSIH